MKIDNITHTVTPSRVEHGKGQEKVSGVAAAQDAAPRQATHLSGAGTDTSQDIDQARVSELRQAIAEGRLTVDTGRIADRLVASVRDLLGSGQ